MPKDFDDKNVFRGKPDAYLLGAVQVMLGQWVRATKDLDSGEHRFPSLEDLRSDTELFIEALEGRYKGLQREAGELWSAEVNNE